MTRLLFKPFLRIAGIQALLLGLFISSITAIISSFGHCHFDGVIDTHIGANTPFAVYFIEALTGWICICCTFYLAGLIFSTSKIRLIDVMGTSLLARWPMLLVALLSLFPIAQVKDIQDISAGVICFGLAALLFTIWMISLLYHAFVISCNMKGAKAVWSFVVALILAELLSKFIIVKLYTIFTPIH